LTEDPLDWARRRMRRAFFCPAHAGVGDVIGAIDPMEPFGWLVPFARNTTACARGVLHRDSSDGGSALTVLDRGQQTVHLLRDDRVALTSAACQS